MKPTALSLIMVLGLCAPARAQESLLDKIIHTRESVVGVRAARMDMSTSPPSAALDPGTGRILVGSRLRGVHMDKNGAGVIIHPEGMIVTNFHTIRYAKIVTVELADRTVHAARIVHLLPQFDLALLQIVPPYPLSPIEFADSNQVHLADRVINIGSSSFLRDT